MSFPAPPWPQAAAYPPPPPPPMIYGNPPPAFTAVSARRAFEPIASPPQPPSPAVKKGEFPPSIRGFVGRCFDPDYAVPGIDKQAIEKKLKEIITQHMNAGTVYTVDWDTMPVAQHFILEEQKRQHTHVSSDPSLLQSNLVTPRKRKSDDELAESHNGLRKQVKTSPFEDRISYKDKSQADRIEKRTKKRQEELRSHNESKYVADLEKRRARFGNDALADVPARPNHHSYRDAPYLAADGHVVGTNQSLEKNYFRLTDAPKPESVRPLHILKQTLDLLKKKWRQDNKYSYICDQFKSLRQDLTVQHIQTDFTVTVYETHARIALEQGDLGEYNQCQTQLRALYKLGLDGNSAEFLAYRILYFIHTCNRTDMNDVLADLTAADKEQREVKHALAVRSASALGNYHKFFRLYLDCPNMGAYLMDMFAGRERLAALANICRAYKPDVKIRFLTEELGFESDSDCVQFLCDNNAQDMLLEADGEIKFATGKAGQLFESAKIAAFRKVDIKGQI